jgi:hypothetical protein
VCAAELNSFHNFTMMKSHIPIKGNVMTYGELEELDYFHLTDSKGPPPALTTRCRAGVKTKRPAASKLLAFKRRIKETQDVFI